MEIKAAIESGDPENYVCHFPVHQDGSCNGLQHYAALGRDEAGGRSVNLTPSECPQDVYSCVVELVSYGAHPMYSIMSIQAETLNVLLQVEEQRASDAARGKDIAVALEGHIKRKVIKQTVMTTVYGVTMYGARLQIAKQLKGSYSMVKEMPYVKRQFFVCTTRLCRLLVP
jgi:DNA-directed RNA polymerase